MSKSQSNIKLLTQTSMPPSAVVSLRKIGIISVEQAHELMVSSPKKLQKIVKMEQEKLLKVIGRPSRKITAFHTERQKRQMANVGMGACLPNSQISFGNWGIKSNRSAMKTHLDAISDNLPSSFHLIDKMQPVSNQGQYPFCVGFSADAALEYTRGRAYSDTYLYHGARSIIPHHEEGTFLRLALEYAFRTGHVTEAYYSMDDAITERPLKPLDSLASQSKINGASCLRDIRTFSGKYFVRLIKAILSGHFSDKLSPHPVPISMILRESFNTSSVFEYGLATVPSESERVLGGHAMVAVGYIDANDENNPLGLDYFIVRNSWGTDFAKQNPLDYAGHVLIPQQLFAQTHDIVEAFMVVG